MDQAEEAPCHPGAAVLIFDVGIVNELARHGTLMPGSTEYGAASEHFIFMELRAHATCSPRGAGLPVSYWRTASEIEVDFILGCRAPRARRDEQGIEILPRHEFLASLWKNEIREG